VSAPLNKALAKEFVRAAQSQPSVLQSNRGGWQSEPSLLTGSGGTLSPALAQMKALALEAIRAMLQQLHRASSIRMPDRDLDPRVRVTLLNGWANVNGNDDFNTFHDHPQSMISGVYYVRIPKARKADAPPRRKREKCDELEATSARTGDETGAKVSAKSGANIGAGTEATKGTCTTSPADDVDTSCKRFQERQTFNGSIELVDPRYSLRLHKRSSAFEPPCEDFSLNGKQLRPNYLFEYAPPVFVSPSAGSFILFPSWLMHRVRPHRVPRAARISIAFNAWVADMHGGVGGVVSKLFDGAFTITHR